MDFDVPGKIKDIETIAAGRGIRDLRRLRRLYGKSQWRKMKGVARIRLPHPERPRGRTALDEAHAIGKKELKAKRYLDQLSPEARPEIRRLCAKRWLPGLA